MTGDWPAPEIPMREAQEGETPASARRMKAAAEAAGWEVLATYCRGTKPAGAKWLPGPVCDSLALRMRHAARDEQLVAFWIDDRWDAAVGRLGKMSARAALAFVKGDNLTL
jgi:hypothetical protein